MMTTTGHFADIQPPQRSLLPNNDYSGSADSVNSVVLHGDCNGPDFDASQPAMITLISDGDESGRSALLAFHSRNRSEIDAKFTSYSPTKPYIAGNTDLLKFMNTPLRKTALFVLTQKDARVEAHKADGRKQLKKAILDYLVTAYPNRMFPKKPIVPILKFFEQITSVSIFLMLKKDLAASLKQRKRRYNVATAKRDSVDLTNTTATDINSVALRVGQAQDAASAISLLVATAYTRCNWILELEKGKHVRLGEVVLSTFPYMATMSTMIKPDYDMMLALRRQDHFDVIKALQSNVMAIFFVSNRHELLPTEFVLTGNDDTDGAIAFKCLFALFAKLSPPHYSMCSTDCVLMEKQEDNVEAFLEQKRGTEIPLLIYQSYVDSGCQYHIVADNIAIKVVGGFYEALEAVMRVHFLFNVPYPREGKVVFTLLEHLAGKDLHLISGIGGEIYHSINDFNEAMELPAPEPYPTTDENGYMVL
uniref:Intu_longin_1 domain-containing protein n=1 Tax=Panagrellus redivivus TaxID=6233 RepID=A0A7E4VCG3_PANRE